jgi:hypothetical protein
MMNAAPMGGDGKTVACQPLRRAMAKSNDDGTMNRTPAAINKSATIRMFPHVVRTTE